MTEAAGPRRGSGLVRSESGGEAIDEDYWPRLLRMFASENQASGQLPGRRDYWLSESGPHGQRFPEPGAAVGLNA